MTPKITQFISFCMLAALVITLALWATTPVDKQTREEADAEYYENKIQVVEYPDAKCYIYFSSISCIKK